MRCLLIINRELHRHKYSLRFFFVLFFAIAPGGLAWHPLSAIMVV
ncbi:hypothetical protein DDI_3283 [Dickeya dianthicola RNS04.9]|nr:hypothetical protein DDI_3283 [Dickeya dianthicola RNS04.9]